MDAIEDHHSALISIEKEANIFKKHLLEFHNKFAFLETLAEDVKWNPKSQSVTGPQFYSSLQQNGSFGINNYSSHLSVIMFIYDKR